VRVFAQRSYASLVSLLAPGECALCSNPLLEPRVAPLCEACLEKLKPASLLQCVRCGEALGMESAWSHGEEAEIPCTVCRFSPPPFVRATSFGSYEGTLRQTIHLLKFRGQTALAHILGDHLATALATLHGRAPSEMLVLSVPLFRSKRPFNQSMLLARRAVTQVKRKHPDWKLQEDHTLLRRVRRTESQFQLSPRQRRLNLRGAFSVTRPSRVANRDILLIDDIYTTGATARECSKTLLAAGASSVHVLTLARAQQGQVAERWQPGTPLHITQFGSA
jgi:ComF family protein